MFRDTARLLVPLAMVLLAACSSQPARDSVPDSGPPVPVNMLAIPEPVPVREPISAAGNKSPYTVNGVTYHVRRDVKGYKERGHASWYGTKFHGQRTANGEVYNMYAMSAAHKTLPLPSYVRVTNLENGRSVIVRVNDRGPFVRGRIIDLSYTAAQKLGFVDKGVAWVEVEALDPDSLPPPGQVLAAEKQASASGEFAEDASYKLPANTYLQVGAYSSVHTADKVRAQLAALVSYPVSVSPVKREGRRLYRVRIGPFALQRALAAARELVEREQLGPPQVVYE